MVTCINLLNFSSNNDVTLASQYIFEHIKNKRLQVFLIIVKCDILVELVLFVHFADNLFL